MKKLFALVLALVMLLSLGVTGFAASDEASAETEEDDGLDAAVTMGDNGELTEREMTENFTLDFFDGGEKTASGIVGFRFESADPTVNFYFSELEEDKGDFYTIGGGAANLTPADSGYDFTEKAVDFMKSVGAESFDSAVLLRDSGEEASCEPVISAKGWTYLDLDGVLLYAEGNARSAIYSDVVGGSTIPGPGAGGGNGTTQIPVVIIRNSLLETTGATGESIDTAISVGNTGGRARGIQPQGKSITYLYDSAIVSRTWGAYSTDSARGSLELVSYNSMGLSTSGYGAYADTSCHLFLYGSEVLGASDGIVASNNGEIYAVASDCELDGTALRSGMGLTGESAVHPADYGADDGIVRETVIAGGDCAVQFHMPDQGHSGAKNTKKATLYMQGGTLATWDELCSDAELSAYNERYAGACIVTKSTQGNVLLDGVDMESRTGVLVHCMINSDSNVNDIPDGETAPGSDFTFKNMTVSGDIVHDDYQRALRLTLDGTELTGAIYSNTCADWNEFSTAELDGQYILNPDGYETFWGVELTLENGAVWNVTETSVLASLDAAGGTVNGTVTENADGTVTVEPLAQGGGDVFRFDLASLRTALGLAA